MLLFEKWSIEGCLNGSYKIKLVASQSGKKMLILCPLSPFKKRVKSTLYIFIVK